MSYDDWTCTTGRLSPLDAAFLEVEDAVPEAHMHLGAMLVLGPATPGHEPVTLEALRERVTQRLDLHPAFRHRLSASRADGLRRPRWEHDPLFRVEHHVRAAALPQPGGTDELHAWAGEFFSHPLDRAHPLWQMMLIEGLADGAQAVAIKLHHCLADGMGAVAMSDLVVDAPSRRRRTPGPPVRPRRLGPADLLREATDLALHPERSMGALREVLAGVRAAVGPIEETAINGPIGTRRSFAAVDLPLSEMREIERGLGGTLNDALLAVTAGGLRRLLARRDAPIPEAGLRAMVPVDVRDDGPSGVGNHITALFVPLPVGIEDPVARHQAIVARTAVRKHGAQGPGAQALVELSGGVPPVLHRALVRLAATPRLFHLTITNVRGPRGRLGILGTPITTMTPFVPLGPEHHLGVALLTYGRRATIGIAADADHVPDLAILVDGLRKEHLELRRAARRAARRSQRAEGARPAGAAPAP